MTPHKCPVCDGTGKENNCLDRGSNNVCYPCNGTGIVWERTTRNRPGLCTHGSYLAGCYICQIQQGKIFEGNYYSKGTIPSYSRNAKGTKTRKPRQQLLTAARLLKKWCKAHSSNTAPCGPHCPFYKEGDPVNSMTGSYSCRIGHKENDPKDWIV